MRKLLLLVLLLLSVNLAATPGGIYIAEVKAPMERTYQAVYQALEEARFWVVFEPNIGESIAGFAEKWGDDYNRNKLEGIRSMVVCNGWYTNQVSNVDPDLLALCPLRINVTHKQGVSRVLFARPSLLAEGSPGLALIQEIESNIVAAIDAAIAVAGKANE